MLKFKWKRTTRKDGKRFNRKKRIGLTSQDIADYAGISLWTLYKLKKLDLKNPDMWTRFWSLVKYLEWKGLRPK